MPGSNSRPNVSEGYEVPTKLPGSTGVSVDNMYMSKKISHKKSIVIIYIYKNLQVLQLAHGAEVACEAHNLEDPGSKPGVPLFFYF